MSTENKTFLIHLGSITVRVKYSSSKAIGLIIESAILGTDFEASPYRIFVKGERVESRITLGQIVQKFGVYEATLCKAEKQSDDSSSESLSVSGAHRESPLKLEYRPPDSPTRVIRIARQNTNPSHLGNFPAASPRRKVFSRIVEGEEQNPSPSGNPAEPNVEELRRLLVRRQSDFSCVSEFTEQNPLAKSDDGGAMKTWAPPPIDEDPVSMSGSTAKLYTDHHPNDLSSFVFSDGLLSAATVRDLFLRLFHGGGSEYTQTFLLAYHYFLSHAQLLELLILYYRYPPVSAGLRAKFQEKVIDLLCSWVKYQNHLSSLPPIMTTYSRFVTFLESYNHIHANCLRCRWSEEKYHILIATPAIKTKKSFAQNLVPDITASDPQVVARQITMIEQTLFHRIPIHEFFSPPWTEATRAPNLHILIEQSNVVPRWVLTTILEIETSMKTRAKTIVFWTKELHEIANFNSLMQIFTALNSPEVDKLKCWKLVPKTATDTMAMVQTLMESNFRLYRSKIADSTNRPFLPIYSLILRDLSMINEMPTIDNEKKALVNWSKVSLLGNVFGQVRQSQSKVYHFKEDPAVLQAIFFRNVWDQDKIEETSRIVKASEEKSQHNPEVRVRSASSSRQLFHALPRKGSSTKNVHSENEFSDLDPESQLYRQFHASLDETKALHLDLYQSLVSFENHPEWPESDIRLVSDGICNQYLGFGGSSAVINLPPQTLQLLTTQKENPSSKLFVAVKMALLREIDHNFRLFQTKSEKEL